MILYIIISILIRFSMKTTFSFASQVCAQAQILRVKNLIFHTIASLLDCSLQM